MRPPRLPFRRPRRPPQSPPFPYTTLFRSAQALARLLVGDQGHVAPGLFDRRDLERAGGASLEVGLQPAILRSEEHTSELQSRLHLVCRLLLEKKKQRLSSRRPSRTLHRPR